MVRNMYRKADVLLIGHVPVATVPSLPNPPVDQCATAKGDFGVYFPDLQKCPDLSFTYFDTFGKPGPNPDFGVCPYPLLIPLSRASILCSKGILHVE